MTKNEIFDRVNKIFQDVFDDQDIKINENTTAEDIDEWDSLIHITLIAEIECEFGIKFEMKDVIGMKNVGEMIKIIEREA